MPSRASPAADLHAQASEANGNGACSAADSLRDLVEAEPFVHIETPEFVVAGLSRLHGTSP